MPKKNTSKVVRQYLVKLESIELGVPDKKLMKNIYPDAIAVITAQKGKRTFYQFLTVEALALLRNGANIILEPYEKKRNSSYHS